MQLSFSGRNIGADAIGVDLGRSIDASDTETIEGLRAALDTAQVVRLRRQKLTPGQIEKLGAYFGPLLNLQRTSGDQPEHIPGFNHIKIISNAFNATVARLAMAARPSRIGIATEP